MFTNLLETINEWYDGLWVAVDFLFLSPFDKVSFAINDSQVLGMLNWLMPISECVALSIYWGTAIGGWYLASTMLRWAKAIQ
jgi:hypothetical protein